MDKVAASQHSAIILRGLGVVSILGPRKASGLYMSLHSSSKKYNVTPGS
jgi:hypothetical protein